MKEKFIWIVRIVIGLTFIISAYSKLIAPGIVEIILIDHGIAANREAAAIFVRILIGLEFALGILFFLPYLLKKLVIPSALIFLIGFTVYLIYTGYVLGDKQNCGCFGIIIEMAPFESIIKNIFLIAGITWLYKAINVNNNRIQIPLIAVVLSIMLTFLVSPIKSIDDLRFSEYTNFVGKGRVDLSDGNKLIAVFNTECDHCRDVAKGIAELKNNSQDFPELYALIFTEGDVSVDSFQTMTGLNSPYHIIDALTFFDLIGTEPPRIYWLKDGMVNEVWDDNFLERLSKELNK